MTPRLKLYNERQELVMEAFGCEEVTEGLAILGYYAEKAVEPQHLYYNDKAVKVTAPLEAGLWVEGLAPFNLPHPVVLEAV